MPKKIKLIENGQTIEIDESELTPEIEDAILKGKVKADWSDSLSNAEVKPDPKAKSWNRIPDIEWLDKMVNSPDSLAKGVGMLTSLMGTGVNPGGLPFAAAGAAMNAKNPPQTWSDAMFNILGPKIAGQAGRLLPKSGGILKQGALQSGGAGITSILESALRDETNRAAEGQPLQDPRNYVPSLQNPEQMLSLITTMGLGGAQGVATGMANKTPSKINSDFMNEMLGTQEKPWTYRQTMNTPQKSNLQIPLDQERQFQNSVGRQVTTQKQSQVLNQRNINNIEEKIDEAKRVGTEANYNANLAARDIRREIGALKRSKLAQNNPELADIDDRIYQIKDERSRITKKADPQYAQQLEADLEAAKMHRQQVLDNINDRILKLNHKMLEEPLSVDFEDYKKKGWMSADEIAKLEKQVTQNRQELTDSKLKMELLKNQAEQGKYGLRTKMLIDSSGNDPNVLAANLLKSSDSDLNSFLSDMKRLHPKKDFTKDVLKSFAQASYDPDTGTFSGFAKNFEAPNNNYPNIQRKLSILYGGDDEKAQRVVKGMQALDTATKANKKIETKTDYATTALAGHIVWQTAKHGLKAGSNIASSVGGMIALSTPKLLDYMARSPKSGKIIQDWLEKGAPSQNLKYGDPIYHALMDAGASEYKFNHDDVDKE